MREIILAGSGWGYEALYLGIKQYEGKVQLLTQDENVIKNKKDSHEIIMDIETIENKVIICSGYLSLIPKEVLEKNEVINIHYSLLPKYRGIHSTVWAILNNENELGLTIHLMNEYIDDGDIIYQYSVKNEEKYSSRDYIEMFNKNIQENIQEVIMKYLSGEILPVKQNKKDATWVGKRNLEDCRINFNLTIEELKRLFRVLVAPPYKLPFFTYKGTDYEVVEVDYHYTNCETHIGRVLNIDNEGVYIKINDGYLIVKKIRNSGEDEILEAKDIIKTFGYKFK